MDSMQRKINALKAELNNLHADDGVLRRMCLTMERINNILMPILNVCRCTKNQIGINSAKHEINIMKCEYQNMKNCLKSIGKMNEPKMIRIYKNSLEDKNVSGSQQKLEKTLSDDENNVHHDKNMVHDENPVYDENLVHETNDFIERIELTCDENKGKNFPKE